jgi:hypothetical protein
MSDTVNEKELVSYIAEKTKADPKSIMLVLQHEQSYINSAQANASGEVEIDGDDLVDFVVSRKDVKLDELTVETILDAEMDYLTEKGLAGYED